MPEAIPTTVSSGLVLGCEGESSQGLIVAEGDDAALMAVLWTRRLIAAINVGFRVRSPLLLSKPRWRLRRCAARDCRPTSARSAIPACNHSRRAVERTRQQPGT